MKTVLAPVYESTRADVDLNDLIIYYEKLDKINNGGSHRFRWDKINANDSFSK